MPELFADVTEDGELVIDWGKAFDLATDFDAGHRDDEAAWAKILTLIQREAFDQGFRKGYESDREIGAAMMLPAGHA